MKRDLSAAGLCSPPPAQVEFALGQIEASAEFSGSSRHRALLRHLVERAVASDLPALKETVIAVEVFGRPAGSFDPRHDSIVRVEVRRLRARLSNFYRAEGRRATIRIDVPVGGYVPRIVTRDDEPPPIEVSRRARDLVERGEHFLRQPLSEQTLEQALARFEAALEESPEHAPAHVGAGRAWLNLATGWYREPAVAAARAAKALRRALDLDHGNAVAHVLLGATLHQFEHDWHAAQRSFTRAVHLAPQQAFVHSAYGCHLLMHGGLHAAERELSIARQLDPQYINTRIHLVNLRLAQRRLVDAEREIEAMRDIAPDTIAIVGMCAMIALLRGDAEGAVRHYERACELAPDHAGCVVSLAGAHAAAGRADVADALLAQTHARFSERRLSPYMLAIFATLRGRREEAFELLRRAWDERDPNAMMTGTDPSFRRLHADARWKPLLAGLKAGRPLRH